MHECSIFNLSVGVVHVGVAHVGMVLDSASHLHLTSDRSQSSTSEEELCEIVPLQPLCVHLDICHNSGSRVCYLVVCGDQLSQEWMSEGMGD